MRSKLLGGAAALTLAVGTIVAGAAPASAQHWGGWRGGWHGGGWHGGGWNGGWRGGFWPAAAAAGIIGGTIAAATSPYWGSGYYDYDPGYAYGGPYTGGDYYPYNTYGSYAYGGPYTGGDYYPYDTYGSYAYGAPAVAVAPGPLLAQTDGVGYCESRFRSYDRASGTYLGYDGLRHPCP